MLGDSLASITQARVGRVAGVLVLSIALFSAAPSQADEEFVGPPAINHSSRVCRLYNAEELISGYVDVTFTVTKEGTVRDPRATWSEACDRAHISELERAAVDAVRDFKYRPRIVDGEAVDVEGVRTRITFINEGRREDDSEEDQEPEEGSD